MATAKEKKETTAKAVETAALQHDQSIIDTGITWRMNLLNVKKK